MLKYTGDTEGCEDLQQAVDTMLSVLKYVNDLMHQIAITGFDVSTMSTTLNFLFTPDQTDCEFLSCLPQHPPLIPSWGISFFPVMVPVVFGSEVLETPLPRTPSSISGLTPWCCSARFNLAYR